MSSVPRRISCALAIGLAGALPATATAALPDLVSERPGEPYVERYHDGRLLLRFDGYVTNAGGAGPFEIRASDPDPATDVMRNVSQWRDVTSPGVGGSPQPPPAGVAPTVVFEDNDDHNHYHLKDAAEYTLWTDDLGAQVTIAQKSEAGFCLEDSTPEGGAYSSDGNQFCWQDHRTNGQSSLVMGISPGFRDVYGAWLSFQWVDITNVPPGRYRLGARVDPRNVVTETDETNNGYRFRPATVPGYRARAVTRAQEGGPVEVTLAAEEFDAEGEPRFTITSPPRHGSLSRAVGEESGDPVVVYTPDPGWRGSDTFAFSVHDSQSRYPLEPPTAAVTLAGETPVVAISGAPPRMTAGTGVELAATVSNAGTGVTWSVDGVVGGDADRGTIAPDGLFQAPDEPPAGGAVTVRATSAEDPRAFAEARIAIDPAPAVQAAPATACAEAHGRTERAPGSVGQVRRSARQLLINQRIAQAAVRRANAAQAWLDAGVRGRDLCGGAIGVTHLGPGVVATESGAAADLVTADPRPVRTATGRRSGDRVSLSRRQLLINQRVSQAAIRRLNALAARLRGGLTGGDLVEGAVGPGKLAADLRVVRADLGVARPAPSRSRPRVRRTGGGDPVRVTERQLVINQRIAQEAVRRSNAIIDQLRAGLSAHNFADDTVVGRNLSQQLRP